MVWGNMRARMNENPTMEGDIYEGLYLHGKGDPNVFYTAGCIAERSEKVLSRLFLFPAAEVKVIPFWVHRDGGLGCSTCCVVDRGV